MTCAPRLRLPRAMAKSTQVPSEGNGLGISPRSARGNRHSAWSCARSACATRRDRARLTAIRARANGGLIVLASPLSIVQRDLIITLAARHRLPAVYSCASSLPVRAYLLWS